MYFRALLTAAAIFVGVGSASAQVLSLEFHDGQVRLIAENVPVGRILAEWARVGGTKIVHGERIPGSPVTLELLDVPEQQALDVVLRGAAGYIVAAREATPTGVTPTGASVLDRILVLPTTSRAPSAASLPPPAAQQAPQFLDQDQDDGPDSEPGQPGGPPFNPPAPRTRVQPGPNPQAAPRPPILPENVPAPDDAPARPTPSNPFGVQGTVQPGFIAPPRNPTAEGARDQ